MFRKGGSTGGITSGLRPGYKDGLGVSSPEFASKMERLKNQGGNQSVDYGDISKRLNIPEAWKQAGEYAYKPRGTNVYDFMTGMGIDLVSRPAAGNIFQQAATSAKEPYDKYLAGKKEADVQRYASQSDIFKTLIDAGAEVLGSEGQGKIFSKQQAAGAIKNLLGDLFELEEKQDTMDSKKFQQEKALIWGQIQQYQRENPAVASLIEDKDWATQVKSKIKSSLKKSIKQIEVPDPENPENTITISESEFYGKGGKKYGGGETELMLEVGRKWLKYYDELMTLGVGAELNAKGGRVGYQNAGAVMPGQGAMMPNQGDVLPGQVSPVMPSDAAMAPEEETMPPELGHMSYEELRSRLPQTITDDIVRLLANSSEALEDFATIQTEQDVSNFNRKYNVNLVLPAGG
jgi:hypothetical protein